MNFSSIPLVPGDPDGPLRVLIIGRISTERQNEENIEASYRSVERYLRQIYHGPLKITHLGEQASGLLTDRATIRKAEELMDTGDIDLIISEDLSRIYRNPRHQYDFVQNAVDRNIRLICIGDHLDTADENWEVMMGAASLRHGLHIPDTRRRIRRTAIHAFHRGGMVSKVKFGYRRLSREEAESARFGPKGLRIAKDASMTPVFCELSSRYRQGASVSSLADWLNDREISPGPYVEKGSWTGRLVKALLADPILCGRRTFRNTVCQPIFRTGKYRQVPNLEPEIELIPELAHLSEDEHRAILAEMKLRSPKRNETRSKRRNRHRRLNVPRKRSLWPGQAMTCAICGSLFYYTGRYLKCRNAYHGYGRSCWNRVQVDAALARRKIVDWLWDFLGEQQGFQERVSEAGWNAYREESKFRNSSSKAPARRVSELEQQAANLAKAIAGGGRFEAIFKEAEQVEEELQKTRKELHLQNKQSENTNVCKNREEFAQRFPAAILELSHRSFDFAELFRRIMPRFQIQPVQAYDRPMVRPRSKFFLAIGGFEEESFKMEQPISLDLFDPPSHIVAMEACLKTKQENPKWGMDRIGQHLDIPTMTVKRAFAYGRQMKESEASNPYRELEERPLNASRWK